MTASNEETNVKTIAPYVQITDLFAKIFEQLSFKIINIKADDKKKEQR